MLGIVRSSVEGSMEWVYKKLVAAGLNKALGWLLEDVSAAEVTEASLSGCLDLRNLRIRKDALVSMFFSC